MGVLLVFLEFLAPGLISVFIGMGALTVAIGIHYEQLSNIFTQIITWMGSSLFYLFTLRLLILKLYPQARRKTEVDEDKYLIGTKVSVIQDIPSEGEGRIRFSDSSWRARSLDGTPILKGETATIQGRDNITYIVELFKTAETKEEK